MISCHLQKITANEEGQQTPMSKRRAYLMVDQKGLKVK
jgi:hypothetical protein